MFLHSVKATGLFIIVFLVSCNPTKRISQGEYLLESYQVEIDSKSIGRDQIKSYIQQRPNKKIVGTKFHLWLHNSSKPNKDNKWNEWLRKNGEEPAIWQQARTDASVENIERFLQHKGYYHATVTDTVIFKKQRASVTYRIKTGWPYTIGDIIYSIPDTSLARLVIVDTVNSLLTSGILLDHDVMRNESKRIETNLKNNGYYGFTEDNILYRLDTTGLNRKVNIKVTVKPYTDITNDSIAGNEPYPLYRIRSVRINANTDLQSPEEPADSLTLIGNIVMSGRTTFSIPQNFQVKTSTIKSSVFLFPDSLYRLSDVNRTYQYLSMLRNFNRITSEFTEPPGQTGFPLRVLDATVSLLPAMRHGYNWEVEGTNSEGNLGGGVRFTYNNKSLFGHAELFDLKLRALVEKVSGENSLQLTKFKSKMEYEAELSVNIPKFILPFGFGRFIQKRTNISIMYNYQQYPEYYVRTLFSTSLGYGWRASDITSHLVKPLDIYFVQLSQSSEQFRQTLDRYPYLRNSYQSHMVVSGSYIFVRDMRPANIDNAFFIRSSFESAGLLLHGAYRIAGLEKQSGKPHKMFGNEFSQFVKGDVDLRWYRTINSGNRIVARIFAGLGWSYGNSEKTTIDNSGATKTVAAMPFEKKYYVGGANSMRGWRLRSLGPGSYHDTAALTSYPNNTGDIKLEANLEYRFDLFWRIEGALFMDAGNVWDSRRDSDRPGADFDINRFYREMALSGGVGFRFDCNIFIIRADIGMKLYDPVGSGHWTFAQKYDSNRIDTNPICLSIAIGYPFF